MIERMPGKVVPSLISLLRASASKSQSLSTTVCVRLSPRQLPYSPRFYASPPTNDPRAPYPANPQFPQQGPYSPGYPQHPQYPQQEPYNPHQQHQQQQYPRYFTPPEQQQQHAPPPHRKRSLRPYIYATIFFLTGSLSGHYLTAVVLPAPLPLPSTPADAALTRTIHAHASSLPIVRSLTSDPAWHAQDAYSSIPPSQKPHRLTTGPLGGARGVSAYQRIFQRADTGDVVTVVWIGGAMAGWPGITHGGVTATIMDETLGRCAIARFPARTGVTARLELRYLRTVPTGAFYVVRARPVEEGSTERKGFVEGSMENVDGKVLVHAKGLFVFPKKKLPESVLKPVAVENLDEGF